MLNNIYSINNINNQKIYSIQVGLNQSGLIDIETIILNGLYRFSILGIKQKNSSDTKDRIYSALRSQKLINLKSDNKKITVNLLPTIIEKKTNIYDLGITLGCLSCMNQIKLNESIIAVGELSILGNIIPTGFLLKSIYQAIKNNIKTVICSRLDLDAINISSNNLQQLIEINNIKIIVGEYLDELVQNIRDEKYHVFKTKTNKNLISPPLTIDQPRSVEILNDDILKIILALCTKRNIFIENKKESYIKKFIKNLIYYNQKLNDYELLIMADRLNINDRNILELYTYPKVSILDNQVQKNDLMIMLNESMFGFNIIENFLNINEESMYVIKKNYSSSIICFYNSCPCGNGNTFFNNINNERCFCIQRNILKYKQSVKKIENGFFDFHINNINNVKTEYLSNDYIIVNNIISTFRNILLQVEEGEFVKIFREGNTELYEMNYLDNIIDLAKDICKLNHIINKDDLVLSKDNIQQAIDLFRKDF